MGFAAEEESTYNKDDVGMVVEMQGFVPAEMSPEDHPLDSNEGEIRKFVAAAIAKKRKYEFEDTEVAPLKTKVLRVPKQLAEPSKDVAKDEESKKHNKRTVLSLQLS